MRLVIIESPYKGDTARNLRYLRSCIRDCINREESPYASHRMLTDALDDSSSFERAVGIAAGLAWRNAGQLVHGEFKPVLPVFYLDLGWTEGMRYAQSRYDDERIPYEERKLLPEDPFFTEVSGG